MAQNAFTVTQANPTPPTNLSYVGNTPPLDPAQAYIDDGIAAAVPNSRLLTPTNANTLNEPAGALTLFAVKVAAAIPRARLVPASASITKAVAPKCRCR